MALPCRSKNEIKVGLPRSAAMLSASIAPSTRVARARMLRDAAPTTVDRAGCGKRRTGIQEITRQFAQRSANTGSMADLDGLDEAL